MRDREKQKYQVTFATKNKHSICIQLAHAKFQPNLVPRVFSLAGKKPWERGWVSTLKAHLAHN